MPWCSLVVQLICSCNFVQAERFSSKRISTRCPALHSGEKDESWDDSRFTHLRASLALTVAHVAHDVDERFQIGVDKLRFDLNALHGVHVTFLDRLETGVVLEGRRSRAKGELLTHFGRRAGRGIERGQRASLLIAGLLNGFLLRLKCVFQSFAHILKRTVATECESSRRTLYPWSNSMSASR